MRNMMNAKTARTQAELQRKVLTSVHTRDAIEVVERFLVQVQYAVGLGNLATTVYLTSGCNPGFGSGTIPLIVDQALTPVGTIVGSILEGLGYKVAVNLSAATFTLSWGGA